MLRDFFQISWVYLLVLSDPLRMGVQDNLLFVTTLLLAGQAVETAVIQAAVDVGEHSELLDMIFRHIEMLAHKNDNHTFLSQGLASALLRAAPLVTVRGNITDPRRRLVVSFTVQASQLQTTTSYTEDELDDDDDDDDEEDWSGYEWRGSGGVLHPVVGVVEPYVLGLAELIFNGVLSSIISNLLESITLVGDTRLV